MLTFVMACSTVFESSSEAVPQWQLPTELGRSFPILSSSLTHSSMPRFKNPHRALNDPDQKISHEFNIPDGLRDRVEFWFDVYTRYDSHEHVIHHSLYPWVVYDVIDTSEIMENSEGAYWARYHKARRQVRQRKREIREVLLGLSQRASFDDLGEDEQAIFKKLSPVVGESPRKFKAAAWRIRAQLGQKSYFQKGLVKSRKYLAYMEEEFRAQGLPWELTRLPFVESSFNEDAESHVGASGIWQIMPRTGAAHMKVGRYIDERNSPLKATGVAGKILSRYFNVFESWPLAVTAYNNGIGNLQRVIRNTQSRDLSKLVERYRRGAFRFASANFYSGFLAALYAEVYHQQIFRDVPSKEKLLVREVLKLKDATPVREVLKLTGITRSLFKKYNLDLHPAIEGEKTLPAGLEIHLPLKAKQNLVKHFDAKRNPVSL